MESKYLILLSAILSIVLGACKKQNNSNNNQSPSSVEEDYINPFIPDSVTEQGGDQAPDSAYPVIPEPVYDEPLDSVQGINTNDLTGLYTSLNAIEDNYSSTIRGYFNEGGSHDYYRNYGKNYVCDKTSFFTDDCLYTLPELDAYLPVCNNGYINKNNNYYNFSLSGSSKEERMSYSLTETDLTNAVVGKKYQEDLFTINDLDATYFEENIFTRISEHKYQCTTREVCEQFISICAPNLINEGYYLTFSRITIETNLGSENDLRIRLYVSSTQKGKLIISHKDEENKPNWYLLFSEALISNVGTTTFAPADSLLS